MYSLLVLAFLSHSDGTSLRYNYKDIATKTKVELSPIEITCSPNDIVVLATPVVNCRDVQYHLHKPNGEVLRIDLQTPNQTNNRSLFRFYNTHSLDDDLNDDLYDPQSRRRTTSKFIVKYINKNVKTMYPKRMYKVINLYNMDAETNKSDDAILIEENQMNDNDFMIGPLMQEDHGNWVLSVYCKDIDGEWIEMFQVITITLIEYVPMKKSEVIMKEGGTFHLSFKYPIKQLETCELTVPSGLPDRFFDRNRIDLDSCGYVIPNITKADQGIWRVVGVGRIVYEGTVLLYVDEYNKRH